jgi:hypothetical protein
MMEDFPIYYDEKTIKTDRIILYIKINGLKIGRLIGT